MTAGTRHFRLLTAGLTLLVLAGCDANPDGPAIPSVTKSATNDDVADAGAGAAKKGGAAPKKGGRRGRTNVENAPKGRPPGI